MSLKPDDPNRKVVPRWRQIARTRSEELQSASGENLGITGGSTEFSTKFDRWKANKNIENSAELTMSALVLGRKNDALEAVRYIARSDEAASSLRMLAKDLLSEDRTRNGKGDLTLEIQRQYAQQRVHDLRRCWNEDPRNSLARIEAARLYLVCGQTDHAIDAMNMAMLLAPENRFVLRSAARLFVHQKEFDHAHDILRRASSVKDDPWVLASEIAISGLAERTSHFLKDARRIIARQHLSPLQTSELTAALGTVELDNGSTKKARKLFKLTAEDPTDNALAQVVWAQRYDATLNLEIANQLFDKPYSHEARVIEARKSERWPDVLKGCIGWLQDEPFASRPAIIGSYVACALVEDYKLGEEFARAGLHVNNVDWVLRNNLVVALTYRGRLKEALENQNDIPYPGDSHSNLPAYLATRGLLQYRLGNHESGRSLYRKAIDAAGRLKQSSSKALACIHLLREELLSGSTEIEQTFVEAERLVKTSKDPELQQALKLARQVQRLDQELLRKMRFSQTEISSLQ